MTGPIKNIMTTGTELCYGIITSFQFSNDHIVYLRFIVVWLIFLSSALNNFGSFCYGPNVFSSFCELIVYANGFYLLLEAIKYPQCFVVVICCIVIYTLGLLCSPVGVVLIGPALIYLGFADFNWSMLV